MEINDEICEVRNKLNNAIENKEDYNIIYKLSTDLDELITKYYINQKDEEENE